MMMLRWRHDNMMMIYDNMIYDGDKSIWWWYVMTISLWWHKILWYEGDDGDGDDDGDDNNNNDGVDDDDDDNNNNNDDGDDNNNDDDDNINNDDCDDGDDNNDDNHYILTNLRTCRKTLYARHFLLQSEFQGLQWEIWKSLYNKRHSPIKILSFYILKFSVRVKIYNNFTINSHVWKRNWVLTWI